MSKSSNVDHVSPVKVDEKRAFAKSCLKSKKAVVCTTPTGVTMENASDRSVNTAITNSSDNRYTLDWWKLYLDSCTNYHSFFAKEFLSNVQDGDTTLTVS